MLLQGLKEVVVGQWMPPNLMFSSNTAELLLMHHVFTSVLEPSLALTLPSPTPGYPYPCPYAVQCLYSLP